MTHSSAKNLIHDMAITSADAATGKLLDARADAYATYAAADKRFNDAYNDAYDKAYARLEKQYGARDEVLGEQND